MSYKPKVLDNRSGEISDLVEKLTNSKSAKISAINLSSKMLIIIFKYLLTIFYSSGYVSCPNYESGQRSVGVI
jgi:hypothetical protein